MKIAKILHFYIMITFLTRFYFGAFRNFEHYYLFFIIIPNLGKKYNYLKSFANML